MRQQNLHKQISVLDLDNIPLGASRIAVASYRLSQLIRSEQELALAKQGDLTLIEWRISLGLSQSPVVSQKELVQFTRMQQPQVSRALMHMEERQLIRSEASNEDKRSKLYSLADKGRALFNRNLPIVTSFCEGLDDALTQQEMSQFFELSERVAKAVTSIER